MVISCPKQSLPKTFENAVSILRGHERPKVLMCSAAEKTGLDAVWEETQKLYKDQQTALQEKRSKQLASWIKEMVLERIQG